MAERNLRTDLMKFDPNIRATMAIQLPGVNGTELLTDSDKLRQIETEFKSADHIIVVGSDGSVSTVARDQFLPMNGYLMHFNISKAKNAPHIEPLPKAHDTVSAQSICMVEGQKQYVLEMEAAVIGVIKDGKMHPQYVGTLVDVGDRTPRVDATGRTYKTWTKGTKHGGSTGMSQTWLQVQNWSEVKDVELEYSVKDHEGNTMLHTPNAAADTLKLWGERLGDWVGNYPSEKLDKLGIVEGVPFLISTGQILLEDDGARSIDPRSIESFTACGVMKFGNGKQIETTIEGKRMPRNEETFSPTEPPFSYYEK